MHGASARRFGSPSNPNAPVAPGTEPRSARRPPDSRSRRMPHGQTGRGSPSALTKWSKTSLIHDLNKGTKSKSYGIGSDACRPNTTQRTRGPNGYPCMPLFFRRILSGSIFANREYLTLSLPPAVKRPTPTAKNRCEQHLSRKNVFEPHALNGPPARAAHRDHTDNY
jgi:hypothetical protein